MIEIILDNNGEVTDFIYRYCNKAFADIKGYRREDIVNHKCLEVFPNSDKKKFKLSYRVAYGNEAAEFDEFYTEKGAYYHVNIMPVGKVGFCACMLRDVKKETLEKIDTNRELKTALDEAQLNNEIISSISKIYYSIYKIDLQKDYFQEISNNENSHKFTGNEGIASEKLKELCLVAVAREYQDEVFKFINLDTLLERLGGDDTIAIEYRVKDGNWHLLRFIVKKKDENGQITNVLCVVRSISDTKRKEQNLLYLANQAKHSNESKTKFLSDMSHDIKTPINGIVGMINIANHYPNDFEVQKKCR